MRLDNVAEEPGGAVSRVSMLQAMVVNRKDGKGANKIEQNASNTCIPCSKPYRFPAQTTRKHPKTLSFLFAPYHFTGLRDCPTQCARLLHPASTRVLPVPQVLLFQAISECKSSIIAIIPSTQQEYTRCVNHILKSCGSFGHCRSQEAHKGPRQIPAVSKMSCLILQMLFVAYSSTRILMPKW